MTATPRTRGAGLDGSVEDAILRTSKFFRRDLVSDDLRTLHQSGGRGADSCYRDRWSHNKVVRCTHGGRIGTWNLNLGDTDLLLSLYDDHGRQGSDSRARSVAVPRRKGLS